MNLIDAYSGDSKNFVNTYDNIKDVAYEMGLKLVFNEDDGGVEENISHERRK